jgi:opacity protein-like surface antigen
MKRIVAVVLALALVGYLGCGANAAEIVKAGSERIAIMGAAHYADFAGDADAYASIFMVATEYGYMVTDQFELAARAMVALAQAGAAGSTVRMQLYSLAAVPKWRIPMEGNISPYIGPKVGVAYLTGSGAGGVAIGGINAGNTFHDAVFVWGAVLGADIFLSKQTALFVEYDFTEFKLKGSDLGGGTIRVRDNGLSAGLAYWW